MKLFEELIDPSKNLLPYDGNVHYFGLMLSQIEADYTYNLLLKEIEWRNDEAIIYGKQFITKRKVAWYGDKEFKYTYSNNTKTALTWTAELLKLKSLIELKTNESFNSCLLNLYHDGSEGMAWHSDSERDLKEFGTIASVSLGAERKFCFKHKISKEKVELQLEHGSLLTMKGTTQKNWLHRLPPTKKVTTPRINLTFRTIEHV